MRTKIVAHRGDREHYPENTLSAFQSAREKGADKIEFDVHKTKDDRLVIHHNYLLGTTNSGSGLITDHDAAYLRGLEAGSWFSASFAGTRIPFLEEVFDVFGGDIEYEIELKGYNEDFLSLVLHAVCKRHLLQHVEFTSPHSFVLTRLKERELTVKTGSFVQEYPSWMPSQLGDEITRGTAGLGHVNVLHCPPTLLSEGFVAEAQKLGVEIHAANCDTTEQLQRALALGVNQLSTNKLDLALRIRASFSPEEAWRRLTG